MAASRRAFLMGGAAAAALNVGVASAHLAFLHGTLAGAVQSLTTPLLTPKSTYSTLYSGQGVLPAMPGVQGSGYMVAGVNQIHTVTAKLDCWDFVIIEAGQSFEVTNVAGNGDTGAVQIAQTVFYFGAAGNFNQAAVVAPGAGTNPSGMTQSAWSGAVGHRVMLQAPTQTADSYADLIVDTYPTNGVPWRQIRRFLCLGTLNSGANRRRAYVDNSVGNDSTAVVNNSAKPFRSITAAKIAAANDAPGTLVWVNETSGANPTTLTSPTRGTLSFPTVYYEDYAIANLGGGGVSNIVPVEMKPANGGRIVITRSSAGYIDTLLNGQPPTEFYWPVARNVDFNATWLMSNNSETVISGFSSFYAPAPNTFADRILMSVNPIRIDITADADNYTEIDGFYADELFAGGSEIPNPTFLGDINGVSTCQHMASTNLSCNSTYTQIGNDIFSTTSANQGEILWDGVLADQSRWLYLRQHVSKTCPIYSVLRDTYNETTVIYLAGAPFGGAAQVAISGNVATVTCFTDTTYSLPKVHRFNQVGYGPTAVFNVSFTNGPLAGKTQNGLSQGFQVVSTTATSFTLNVAGLGLANTAATNSGVFTYCSNENNHVGIYDQIIEWKTNAANPSNVFKFSDADNHQSTYPHPAFNAGGGFPNNGCMPFVSSNTGLGASGGYAAPIAPSLLVARTPRVISSGSTLTGKGFLNGGASADNPALTTTITTQTTSGRTLVTCSGALPALYWGCTVVVGSQKLKVANYVNNNPVSFTTPVGVVMPPNSFFCNAGRHLFRRHDSIGLVILG